MPFLHSQPCDTIVGNYYTTLLLAGLETSRPTAK